MRARFPLLDSRPHTRRTRGHRCAGNKPLEQVDLEAAVDELVRCLERENVLPGDASYDDDELAAFLAELDLARWGTRRKARPQLECTPRRLQHLIL